MYFESHAHYDDRRFKEDRHEILASLSCYGVDKVVNVGANIASSKESIKLAEKYPFVYAAVGVHPHDVKSLRQSDLETLERLCAHKKVVAVGEIGLDYYYDNSPRDVQVDWFKKQLAMTERVGLPVIIHSREAARQTFDIIQESGVRRGVIHCYSGSAEMALEYVKMGFYIGVGGVVTYPNAKALIKTVECVPIENILLETDCPYLPPIPKRGERNNSQYLNYICQKISQIKQIPNEEVAKMTFSNACCLFGLKKPLD